MNKVKDQISTELATLRQIERELQQEFLERDDVIRASLVALVAKSHLVILGPPGTAKSAIVTAISKCFCDQSGQGLNDFVYLLTRFTTPEELFGPVSVSGLKNDTYERVTRGKLPEAQVAFLDEIFKSSSAVLNILLTILNERLFDNGTSRVKVPLITLFGASNEMPQEETDLAALWDRFMIRLQVSELSDGNFEKLIGRQGSQISKHTIITQQALEQLQASAESLPIPASITAALAKLRRELKQERGITASDRRWVQCLRILQANALIEGHSSVEEDDLAILVHCLWSDPKDKKEISGKVEKLVNPLNAKAAELKDLVISVLKKMKEDVASHPGEEESQVMTRSRLAFDALKKIQKAEKDLEDLKDQAKSQGMKTNRIDQALTKAKEIDDYLMKEVY